MAEERVGDQPIPYPSGVTGPKPNRRKAGLPQLLVDNTLVPRRLYAGSVNIAGTDGLSELPFVPFDPFDLVVVACISRCMS
jgi:hypothetical protein